MQLSSALVLGLGLASTTSGFVVTMFKGAHCTGESKRHNVWDSSCSSPDFGPKSVRVEVYGSAAQQARFHRHKKCPGNAVLKGPWFADHANAAFKVGNCIDTGGEIIWSFGSY